MSERGQTVHNRPVENFAPPPRVRAELLVDALGCWDRDSRRWWRALLEKYPSEALFIAELALVFEAVPRDE